MNKEQKIAEQLSQYQELAKQNKNIDVASLMLNALASAHGNSLSHSQKRWAYLLSVGAPPFGLIFAGKFFMSDKDDARTAAWICVILTIFSILAFFIFLKLVISNPGVSYQQLQQIKPVDVNQLLQ